MKTTITKQDLLTGDAYTQQRKQLIKDVISIKKDRRIHVGPDVTFYFENYQTIKQQIQEMLHIEKGGDAQINDELDAYQDLIPNGKQLVVTLMFEIENAERRAQILSQLGGVENTIQLEFDSETIKAEPLTDLERTTAEGKTSSVHFLKFNFNEHQIAVFKQATKIQLSIAHENYSHIAMLSTANKTALTNDFLG